jgi:phosphoribosylaminoimidazole-succinocarboxamide synthase
VSAFDRVLGHIPLKGQVLNQLSSWWFHKISDIVDHHLIDVPDPNVSIVRKAEVLPVEVIVRGFITGVTSTSLWTLYSQGIEKPYGLTLPEGLKKNDKLPEPVITPTTKATGGAHDERLTCQEVLDRKLVDSDVWEKVQDISLKLFKRGQEIAEDSGLILVDTKYEFGLIDGELVLIDEIHTPDSSRYWRSLKYSPGDDSKQISYSKEFLRQWFKDKGYTGEGEIPEMPLDFIWQVSQRYINAYELLTGRDFKPAEVPAISRIENNLKVWK